LDYEETMKGYFLVATNYKGTFLDYEEPWKDFATLLRTRKGLF
jgi:hypothetical protein